LVITVDDPAYRFELQNYWYTQILSVVQAAVPEARLCELKFVLDVRPGGSAGRRGEQTRR
jgi:hypothetical protein